MKKIILFISVIGLFILASCDTKNPDNESSNSIPSTIETSTQNEPSKSSENIPSTSEIKEGDKIDSSTIEESKKDDNAYDDDLPWGPLH